MNELTFKRTGTIFTVAGFDYLRDYFNSSENTNELQLSPEQVMDALIELLKKKPSIVIKIKSAFGNSTFPGYMINNNTIRSIIKSDVIDYYKRNGFDKNIYDTIIERTINNMIASDNSFSKIKQDYYRIMDYVYTKYSDVIREIIDSIKQFKDSNPKKELYTLILLSVTGAFLLLPVPQKSKGICPYYKEPADVKFNHTNFLGGYKENYYKVNASETIYVSRKLLIQQIFSFYYIIKVKGGDAIIVNVQRNKIKELVQYDNEKLTIEDIIQQIETNSAYTIIKFTHNNKVTEYEFIDVPSLLSELLLELRESVYKKVAVNAIFRTPSRPLSYIVTNLYNNIRDLSKLDIDSIIRIYDRYLELVRNDYLSDNDCEVLKQLLNLVFEKYKSLSKKELKKMNEPYIDFFRNLNCNEKEQFIELMSKYKRPNDIIELIEELKNTLLQTNKKKGGKRK